MVITKEVQLPTNEVLTVDEVNVSQNTLISAAPYIGKHCEGVNNEFMLCRLELQDPRACIELGKRVTACTMQLFRNIKKECLQEFNQYSKCIDKSSGDFKYEPCRKTQAVFDCCMKCKLNMDRPDFGYFTRARVHTSSSPAPTPPPCPCKPAVVVPDPTPSLPDSDEPRPPARFGSRYYYMTE